MFPDIILSLRVKFPWLQGKGPGPLPIYNNVLKFFPILITLNCVSDKDKDRNSAKVVSRLTTIKSINSANQRKQCSLESGDFACFYLIEEM